MVGYSTIIDYVSIVLIKLAEREGIHCNVDVIEIPKQFFDKELLGKLDIHELPYFDECLKTGMLDGFKRDLRGFYKVIKINYETFMRRYLVRDRNY